MARAPSGQPGHRGTGTQPAAAGLARRERLGQPGGRGGGQHRRRRGGTGGVRAPGGCGIEHGDELAVAAHRQAVGRGREIGILRDRAQAARSARRGGSDSARNARRRGPGPARRPGRRTRRIPRDAGWHGRTGARRARRRRRRQRPRSRGGPGPSREPGPRSAARLNSPADLLQLLLVARPRPGAAPRSCAAPRVRGGSCFSRYPASRPAWRRSPHRTDLRRHRARPRRGTPGAARRAPPAASGPGGCRRRPARARGRRPAMRSESSGSASMRMPRAAADHVEEEVGGDAVQPALERAGLVGGQRAEHPDERLLREVLGVVLVAGEPVGQAVDPVGVLPDDIVPARRRPVGAVAGQHRLRGGGRPSRVAGLSVIGGVAPPAAGRDQRCPQRP